MRADVLAWSAPPESLDLVLVAYLHVPEDDTRALLARAVGWLRPGGRLLVLGHDVENIASGVGGPQEPAILHSVDRLAPVADRLRRSTGWSRCRGRRPPERRWTRCCGAVDRADLPVPAVAFAG